MRKLFWFIRLILFSPFFGKVKFPSYLGKPVSIEGIKNIFIGKRVRIYPNARLEVHGKDSKLEICDNVGIAQNVHITTGSELRIGKGTTILANVLITDIDHDYSQIDVPILEQKNIIKKTEIGEYCFIGIGAAIQACTILGKQCIVGAHSVVRGEFPDYCVIVGTPARIVKKFNFITNTWEKI